MRNSSNIRMLPLGAITAIGLASCSLPPGEAWRQIRQEGLITYLVNDENRSSPDQSAPTQTAPQGQQALAQSSTPTAPRTQAPIPSVPAPSQLDAGSMPVAQVVPGLEGYVRSPFTNPPRLVDVRGMSSGSKVVCPYTRRPFLVPNMGEANNAVASAPKQEEPAPAPAPVKKTEEDTKPKPTPAPTAPSKVAAVTTPAPQPPPAPVVKPQPKPEPQVQAKTTPPSAPQQTPPAPTAPKTSATELPFGVLIPGRPGFVNSPYAAKHQLVDVTGLPTGMEVKCPYTGKLFRVPPQANNQ